MSKLVVKWPKRGQAEGVWNIEYNHYLNGYAVFENIGPYKVLRVYKGKQRPLDNKAVFVKQWDRYEVVPGSVVKDYILKAFELVVLKWEHWYNMDRNGNSFDFHTTLHPPKSQV